MATPTKLKSIGVLPIAGGMYQVGLCDTLTTKEGKDILGYINYSDYKIYIVRQSKQATEHTLLHETVHGWLRQLCHAKLADDEVFVDAFANLMLQVGLGEDLFKRIKKAPKS